MSTSDDSFVTHLNAARFLAQRSIFAQTVTVIPPPNYALPGALVPIAADRLEAHQDDGLDAREIVEYENAQFLKTNIRVRERHAQWVGREYDAMVKLDREFKAEAQRREAHAAAEYQRRLDAMLERKDTDA